MFAMEASGRAHQIGWGAYLIPEGICMHDQISLMRPPHKAGLRLRCSACIPARAPWTTAGCRQPAGALLIWRIGAACRAVWAAALCSAHEWRHQALQHMRSNVNKRCQEQCKALEYRRGCTFQKLFPRSKNVLETGSICPSLTGQIVSTRR